MSLALLRLRADMLFFNDYCVVHMTKDVVSHCSDGRVDAMWHSRPRHRERLHSPDVVLFSSGLTSPHTTDGVPQAGRGL